MTGLLTIYTNTSRKPIGGWKRTIINDLNRSYRDRVMNVQHRKPDIVRIDPVREICDIIEITVCDDLYVDKTYNAKNEQYHQLVNTLRYSVTLYVLCFGSLGCIMKQTRKHLIKILRNKEDVKSTLKWCSISNAIYWGKLYMEQE